MILPPFQLHRPASLAEAVATIGELGADAVDVLAGGSDLLPNYKQRLNPRPHVVSLAEVGDLRTLGEHAIGATVTLHELATDARWRDRFPGLCEAAAGIASDPIRRQATCGGNVMVDNRCFWFNQFYDWRVAEGFCLKADGDICRVIQAPDQCVAMYPGELAPNLMVLDASFHLVGPEGARDVPAREFFRPDGIARNHRKPGEVLVRIDVPETGTPSRTGYVKVAVRKSVDFAEGGIAVGLDLVEGKVSRLEVATTALDMVPQYLADLKPTFEGRDVDDAFLAELEAAVQERVNPMKNTFLSPEYRRRVAGVHAKRLVARLAAG